MQQGGRRPSEPCSRAKAERRSPPHQKRVNGRNRATSPVAPSLPSSRSSLRDPKTARHHKRRLHRQSQRPMRIWPHSCDGFCVAPFNKRFKNSLVFVGGSGWWRAMPSAAWQRSTGKNKNGGLNERGRRSYERSHPGSNLRAPSKRVGNPRRASFCTRMKGMKKKLTSKKTARDPNSRINKSLRAWNC